MPSKLWADFCLFWQACLSVAEQSKVLIAPEKSCFDRKLT